MMSPRRTPPMRYGLLLCVALFATTAATSAAADPCIDNAVLGITPLIDFAPGETYQGFPGGLYPDGNTPPLAHHNAAQARAQMIRPLDAAGAPNPNGRIVLLSLGMSNTTQEFSDFVTLAASDPRRNPRVLVVDGAQGGRPADDWVDPASDTWTIAIAALQNPNRGGAAGTTPAQVEAIWLKQALKQPQNLPGGNGVFPGHAQVLKDDLVAIVRNALGIFPNLKLVFVSSRTRAYVVHVPPNGTLLNPEPYAFESGFSAKWLIEQQISGDPNLNFDPDNGAVVAPLLLWGPYIWADGVMPRSDGFAWLCSDTRSPPIPNGDYTHPSEQGQAKIGQVLLDFFTGNEFARPWFIAEPIFRNGFDASTP